MNKLPIMTNLYVCIGATILVVFAALMINAAYDLGEVAWGMVTLVVGNMLTIAGMIAKHYVDSGTVGK